MGERLPYRHGLSLLLTPQFSGEVCCVDASCSWLIASVLKWQGAIDVGLLQRKGCRKKLLQRLCAHAIDAHIRCAWHQFLHHLTAGAAWHAGTWRCIGLGIDAAHGQFNWTFALADRGEESNALRTNAQPITGIFHVAAVDHAPVITPHGGPHMEVRIGAMGAVGSLPCPFQQELSVVRGRSHGPSQKGCSGFVFHPIGSTAIAG